MKYGKKFYAAYNGQFAGDTLSPEIVRLANRYITGKVLDVGAGSGAMIKAIKRLNPIGFPVQQGKIDEVWGIDICPTNDDIIEAPITKIPFVDNYFDTIVCSEVLEHLDDETLTKGIQEIYRVLKPAGYVIITTPYKDELKNNMVKCPCCNAEFHRWGHVQSFDGTAITSLLHELNAMFNIIKLKTLPLGFMSTHKYLKYLIPWINNFPLVRYEQRSIFIVAKKVTTPTPLLKTGHQLKIDAR